MQTRLELSRYFTVAVRQGLIGLFLAASPVFATDLNVSGNLTVSGTVSSGGPIDSDSNSQSFGAQSTSTPLVPGSIFTYTDDSVPTGSVDSFKSLINRTPASWLWLNGPDSGPFVNAMRLDDAHQLLLFKSDGTTAGLTFTPQTYTIKLGTHANATLTGNTTTGLITSGGGLTVTGPLTVSGGITNDTGSFGGDPKFDNVPYTPPTTLSPTTGSASFAWGGVYVGTLTGNLTISSFSGTEAAGKKVRFILVCSGSQSLTFPASYRAGQTNETTTTFTPVAGRHVLLFESLDGAGLRLLTDTVFGQLDAASVAVAASPSHYSAASANVEAHLSGIDSALASAGSASVSDAAYNATTWNGVTTVAPSKNAVRDQLETISAGAVVPPQMANFWPTADLSNKPAGWLVAGEGGTPTATAVGGYSMIVKSNGDVAAPTFSPAAGTYSSTQNVTLSTATSGALIRYTVDGSSPTRSSGFGYSSPIPVATSLTIKAIAYKDYWADSAVQSSAYIISPPPTLSSATILSAGNVINLLFSKPVNVTGSVPVITMSGGASTLSSPTGGGTSTLVYTLSRTVNSGETGTIAYTQPGGGIRDLNNIDLATFSGASVTNDSTQGIIVADLWQVFSNAALSTTNLNNEDSIATGTWTLSPSTPTTLSTSTSGQQAFSGQINSTTDTSTRGLAMSMTSGSAETIGYAWGTGQGTNPTSFGFWFKMPSSLPGESVVPIFNTYGNSEYVIRVGLYNDGANNTFRIRGNGSWTDTTATVSTNTWYRIAVISQAGNTCSLSVYTTSGTKVGDTITVTANDSTQAGFSVGADASFGTGTGSAYWDNIVVKTNSSTEVGP